MVSHRARHPSEQRRHLRPRLSETEDVVDEHQHVLVLAVAEVLGYSEARQSDAKSRTRRLVHLPVDQCGGRQHSALFHFEIEVVPLARALAHAAKHRPASVTHRNVVDQLHDDHGLSHARSTEETGLSALHERGQEINDLDTRLEHVGLWLEVLEKRWLAVNKPSLYVIRNRLAVVYRFADHVENSPQRDVTDWNGDRPTSVHHLHSPHHAICGAHRDCTNLIPADVLLHFSNKLDGIAAVYTLALYRERVVKLGQRSGLELYIEHRSNHLNYLTNVGLGCH